MAGKSSSEKEREQFLTDLEYSHRKEFTGSITREFYEGLKSGSIKKPSDYIKKDLGWFLDMHENVPERVKEYLFYSVDSCIKWQYSEGFYRRSFRTARYDVHFEYILGQMYSYRKNLCVDSDAMAILSGTIPPTAEEYLNTDRKYNYGDSSPIACELDRGNKKLEDKITDIIMGEGGIPVSYTLIRGIVKSENKKMHELLGRLLLAARLQEGVRQAICESADHGTAAAFRLLMGVIAENDLIRFSSVSRAVGTWTGLMTDSERIGAKTFELICQCLDSEEARREFLDSEDSMKIYLALWAEGFYEADNAKRIISEISKNGTHHQLLTAGYILPNLCDVTFMSDVSKTALREHYREEDTAAVYMPGLLPNFNTRIYKINEKNGFNNYSSSFPKSAKRLPFEGDDFKDSREAEEFYSILREIRDNIKGREREISPCIFPWYSVKLSKSEVIEKMACIASLLQDNDRIDEICSCFSDISPDGRNRLIPLLLCEPATDLQRRTLIASLCDKGENARGSAFAAVGCVKLTREDCRQMEELLRYKAADARANIISLLTCQPDDDLYDSVSGLLADKKEEKRTAALDIILQISKDGGRGELFEKCRSLAMSLEKYSTKEKVLIDSIAAAGEAENEDAPAPLYSDSDRYVPTLPEGEYLPECTRLFMEYFPDSEIGFALFPKLFKKPAKRKADCDCYKQAAEDIRSLEKFIADHRGMEFTAGGVTRTIDCESYEFYTTDSKGARSIPFKDDWHKWAADKGLDEKRLMRMMIASAYSTDNEHSKRSEKYIIGAYGRGFEKYIKTEYSSHMGDIIDELRSGFTKLSEALGKLSFAMAVWFLKTVDSSDIPPVKWEEQGRSTSYIAHIAGHNKLMTGMGHLRSSDPKHAFEITALKYIFIRDMGAENSYGSQKQILTPSGAFGRINAPSVIEFVQAAYRGEISEQTMYWCIFADGTLDGRKRCELPNNLGDALDVLSAIAWASDDIGRQKSAGRGFKTYRARNAVMRADEFVGRCWRSSAEHTPYTEEEQKMLRFAVGVYEKLADRVLYYELRRGDSEAVYSRVIRQINRIYGVKNFAAILCALGSETLERSDYPTGYSKRTNLSHLLGVCCPDREDTADSLRELIKDTDITEKRLIEAAMYSPAWLDIIAEYLGWEGFASACWYFMAHMNERFDDARKAIIARYTPLTDEELNNGAFDIDWFRSAHDTVGDKRFNIIYDCAKYISDGSKHSRARKYADAVMGKMSAAETKKTVADKRNKDLLMAYALIPIENEDDLFERYLYLQQFLKESKSFGSQRSASEKKAVETAMQNLSINAGFSDVTRLTLKMETKLIDDSRELFEEKQVGGVTVRLSTDEGGKTEIVCTKDGKQLKSIPAAIKKNEYVLTLTEIRKRLNEQYRRTRVMFEQAMEDRTEFTVGEITDLQRSPVALPIVKDLVFTVKGKPGFIADGRLIDCTGKSRKISPSDKAVIAHPFDLYHCGQWADFQKYLFENKLVQPFKQVFRELYVKTPEEAEMRHSLRYAGNQIQPAKTAACLKSRRWVADVENGLQKVYYKENIVAEIYAMADWFSPADIEAPTLEWVCFTDRNTGRDIAIKDVPDVIFSEVMRDVDLAVSVAHAGGVDPETSHSTMEMRKAILDFTLPLFRLTNVRTEGTHAHIDGKLASYTVHLGSGVVHKKGGAMIAILPVHSQQRGRLFLPFADDDPKTAEIITKVLFLAEDSKIKDPAILAQIGQEK